MSQTRRAFLRSVGAVGAALPLARMLAAEEAHAQQGAGPLRFVGVYHPHGATSPLYLRRAGETDTRFDLRTPGSVLAPFDDAATYGRSFKDRLLVLEGIDLASAIRAGATGHSAPSSILTGWGGDPSGPSLDQYLAVDRGLGAMTPVTSLVLGVGTASSQRDDCISFASNGAPLTKLAEPHLVFERVFASLVSAEDPAARRALESRQRAERSVLDFVRGDLARLSRRLGPTERAKLDQHATSLRELEKRVDALTQTMGGAACTVPSRPAELPRSRSYNGGEPYFEEITNLHVDLLAQALACDQTRFASLWLADLSRGAGAGTGLDVPEDVHNDIAHTYSAPRAPHYGSGAPGDPATWARLGVQNLYSYGKVARLLQRLHERGILDDTIVLVASDMGDPAAHSSRNVPMLLAGGGGLRAGWTMGRRVAVQDDCPPDRYYCDSPTLVPHNKVLLSIARAFGATELTQFGDPALEGGTLW